jgi:hypothetical protein
MAQGEGQKTAGRGRGEAVNSDLYKALRAAVRQQQMARQFASSWREMTAWQHKKGSTNVG